MLGIVLSVVMSVAMVVEDDTPMLASPEITAPQQAQLWRGDWLEVRGESKGFIKVYDHRHERPGFVAPWRVRSYQADEAHAPALKAIVSFMKDQPGSESLGIGYAALFLRAAPTGTIDAEVIEALATMSHRLAERASSTQNRWQKRLLPHHLHVAESYGIEFRNHVVDEETSSICYDGKAFRRLLAIPASPKAHAHAALALTESRCFPTAPTPREQRELDEWSITVLDKTDPLSVSPYLGNRLRMRRANSLSRLAYSSARSGDLEKAATLSENARNSFLRIDKSQLLKRDESRYARTAMRVASMRWARHLEATRAAKGKTTIAVSLKERSPGETCIRIGNKKRGIERCTYALVLASSVQQLPGAVAISVQPLPGWQELWVFQVQEGEWVVNRMLPATGQPELGYVELAGYVSNGKSILVVREALVEGSTRRRFQRVDRKSMAITTDASSLRRFRTFKNNSSPRWKSETLSLR